MKRLALLAALCAALCAAPLGAQDLPGMSGAQFETYVTGKTLTWSFGSDVWGVEEYLEGRRVQWASQPDQCEIGEWFESNGQICFQYEGRDAPSCWIFRQTATGLTADLQGPSGPLLLQESGQSDQGLPCPGPDVGV